MSPKKLEQKIDRATEARARARADGDAQGAFDAQARLDELWQELRLARARSSHGSPDQIVRRARVDRELEKLMAPQAP